MTQNKKKSKNKSGNNVFSDAIQLFRKCGLNLALFELLFKLGSIAVLYPLFVSGFNLTLKISGHSYLTNNYFFTYIKSPATIIFFFLMIVIQAFNITYEVSCLSVCFDAAYHKNPISIWNIFRSGSRLMRRTMKKKKILSVLNITIISVSMNITLLGFVLSDITIPDAAKKVIRDNRAAIAIAGIVVIIFFAYSVIHMFAINYMTYDGENMSDSLGKSRRMIKDRLWRTLLTMLCWNLVIMAAIFIIYLIVLMTVCAGVTLLDAADIGMAVYLSAFRVFITIIKIVLTIVAIPVTFGVITSLFYRYRCDSGNELNMGEITEGVVKKHGSRKHGNAFYQLIALAVSLVFLATDTFYLLDAFDNSPFDRVELLRETKVMAHRGSSYNAPENTMAAFENAVAATADYIELDVHETRDGVIVVMHDSNLKRTTGVNGYIWDHDYEEISSLDAGSWFDSGFSDCHIPTLDEVMDYTKGKIKLNIEIKLSRNEPGLVSGVAELIEKHHYENDCCVTSMNYEALCQMKAINPRIETGYVLMVAYGGYYKLDNVDDISIDASYVNKSTVDTIHNYGKKVFAWTVNNDSRARKLAAIGVDAIITDNPAMGREAVYAHYSNRLITNVLSYVFKR